MTLALLLVRDDLDGNERIDLVVEMNLDLVLPEPANGVVQPDQVAVDPLAQLLFDRTSNVGLGYGPEQATALPSPSRDVDGRCPERGDARRRLFLFFANSLRAGALHVLRLFQRALRCEHRQALRDEVVARVTVGNGDDVALMTELVYVAGEDDLHVRSYLAEYGSKAISRAFLIAVATSRWCCVQLPVTRRARILPRSLT